MRISKKKFIYLISPTKIHKNFYSDLAKIFKLNKVGIFQLRLKKEKFKTKVLVGKRVKSICEKFKVKFIINDDPKLAKVLNADGCHLGQKDCTIHKARKILNDKIIGVTCHNSFRLVKKAFISGADYVAIGAFFNTRTKNVRFKAEFKLIGKVKSFLKIPLVVIGGINSKNYKKLLLHKADFLAISSYVWKNKKLNPVKAINEINI